MKQTLRHWFQGVRLYIAIGSVLFTGLTIWWSQVSYGGSSLASIRCQEVFAWLALILLLVAVSIGPVLQLFPKIPLKGAWYESRRLVGVSGAWFASLHVGIAYIVQFKSANPLSLPSNYQTSFLLGILALLILLAMAATSYDGAFKKMGIWWFRLHRFVYAAVVLTLFHLLLIGTHAAELPVLIGIAVIGAMLLAVHASISLRNRKISTWQIITISSMAILLVASVIFGFHERAHTVAMMNRSQTEGQIK